MEHDPKYPLRTGSGYEPALPIHMAQCQFDPEHHELAMSQARQFVVSGLITKRPKVVLRRTSKNDPGQGRARWFITTGWKYRTYK